MNGSSSSVRDLLQSVKRASFETAVLTSAQKNRALKEFARLISSNKDWLISENAKDLKEQDGKLAGALYQRLKLDAGKIKQLIDGLRDLVKVKDPVGVTLVERQLDKGLILEKQSVPIGVVGVIFESRPDVIPQILALVLKSGNAAVLKGGKEALHSNRAFMELVRQLGESCKFLPRDWAKLVESRETVHEMLHFPEYVDLVIPRGGNQLVQAVMNEAHMPVLGHADGVCHLFVHRKADLAMAVKIAIDAKAQYPSACNAIETLLVDEPIAEKFLPLFEKAAKENGIRLKGCEKTKRILQGVEAVAAGDWHVEYGDLTLNIRIVDDVGAAIEHVNRYGSHHTEAIVTKDKKAAARFQNEIDSACIFVNASTRFADGYRFGMGAEVGISTSKTHARGPVGIEGLIIYKYRVTGTGHVVADYVGEKAKKFRHRDL